MSGSVNKAIILGNVVREPEVKMTSSGQMIANFSVATNESWRDKHTGEKKERTEYHRVACFSEPLCKIIEQYVHKGTKLYIEGQIQTRSWEDQSGAKRYSTEIVLQGFNATLTLLGGPSDAPQASAPQQSIDDEIPF